MTVYKWKRYGAKDKIAILIPREKHWNETRNKCNERRKYEKEKPRAEKETEHLYIYIYTYIYIYIYHDYRMVIKNFFSLPR